MKAVKSFETDLPNFKVSDSEFIQFWTACIVFVLEAAKYINIL